MSTEAIVAERGKSYGPPAQHFARTVGILAIVFGSTPMNELEPRDWPIVMVCDKLARFAESRSHADSVRDICGYGETWFLAQEPDHSEAIARASQPPEGTL